MIVTLMLKLNLPLYSKNTVQHNRWQTMHIEVF